MLLIVQCDSGNINGPLAACARYCVMDELQKIRETMRFPFHVVFIIQLPRIAGGCFTGFQVRTQVLSKKAKTCLEIQNKDKEHSDSMTECWT